MAPINKLLTICATFIVWSLLIGCDVDSEVAVDQESASISEVSEQMPVLDEDLPAAAIIESTLPQLVVTPTMQAVDAVTQAEPLTFTVVTYNVENLFDADGFAMFDDYKVILDTAHASCCLSYRASPVL
jgi:hypothetical protein